MIPGVSASPKKMMPKIIPKMISANPTRLPMEASRYLKPSMTVRLTSTKAREMEVLNENGEARLKDLILK